MWYAEKPPLVCHLLSPVYAQNNSDKSYLMSQTIPQPGVCDFVVLELPLQSPGMYSPDSYDFLPNGTAYTFLFTVNLIRNNFAPTNTALKSIFFQISVRNVLKKQGVPLYGFGFLRDVRIPSDEGNVMRSVETLKETYQVGYLSLCMYVYI
ncbi:hypothetical protein MRX96_026174 [Rhipicephalus microplus]